MDGQTGAGVAAARIHEGLIARGIDSRFCVVHPVAGVRNSFSPQLSILGRAARKARRALDDRRLRPHAAECDYVLSTGNCGFDIGRIAHREEPDIVQLHWIGGNSFNLSSLQSIRAPIVWRLSDQWPFCGIQHLEPDRRAYAMPPPNGRWLHRSSDFSERVRLNKWLTYQRLAQLVLVCPSRWLMDETRHSALLGDRPIELIPTSCDTELFSPKDRNVCREALGISQESFVVLVGATSMRTKWKGLDLFIQAMAEFGNSLPVATPVEIVTFGQDAFDAPALNGVVRVTHLGPVRERRLMSILYNAVDLFAAPSRMENLANTVLESLACGTPVVAFAIGGMPDMIEHRVNGYLASPFDIMDFAQGIRWGLAQRGCDEVRENCRRKIVMGFSTDREIEAYLRLYNALCQPRRQTDPRSSSHLTSTVTVR